MHFAALLLAACVESSPPDMYPVYSALYLHVPTVQERVSGQDCYTAEAVNCVSSCIEAASPSKYQSKQAIWSDMHAMPPAGTRAKPTSCALKTHPIYIVPGPCGTNTQRIQCQEVMDGAPVCSQTLRHVPPVLQTSPTLQVTPVGRIPLPGLQLSPISPD